jgi:hypothetical protein
MRRKRLRCTSVSILRNSIFDILRFAVPAGCQSGQFNHKEWSYLCGSGFPAAIKRLRIYSDFLSWLETHSHEQMVFS